MKRSLWIASTWLVLGLLLSACQTTTPAPSPIETAAPPAGTAAPTDQPPAQAPTVQATDTVAPPPADAPPVPDSDYGPAPEIDTDVWLNTDVPLRLGDLRGQVIIVEFWTYG